MKHDLLVIQTPIECKVISRLNRFTVKIEINGRVDYAYIMNTGRLQDLLYNSNVGICAKKESGRLKYLLFAVKCDKYYAIIDTRLQMKAFEHAVSNGLIPWLKNCKIVKRDVKVFDSKLDYLLSCKDRKYYTEVKSAVLKLNSYASYPDCPSTRGRRHIMTLIKICNLGLNGLILFIAGLPNVKGFKPNYNADRRIYELLRIALDRGVAIKAISMYFDISYSRIILDNPDLPVCI